MPLMRRGSLSRAVRQSEEVRAGYGIGREYDSSPGDGISARSDPGGPRPDDPDHSFKPDPARCGRSKTQVSANFELAKRQVISVAGGRGLGERRRQTPEPAVSSELQPTGSELQIFGTKQRASHDPGVKCHSRS
jgi:hypothetical protein